MRKADFYLQFAQELITLTTESENHSQLKGGASSEKRVTYFWVTRISN